MARGMSPVGSILGTYIWCFFICIGHDMFVFLLFEKYRFAVDSELSIAVLCTILYLNFEHPCSEESTRTNVCLCVCVRACVRACVRVCVCVRESFLM